MSVDEHDELRSRIRTFFSVVDKNDCRQCVVTYVGIEEQIICELDDVRVLGSDGMKVKLHEEDERIVCSFARFVALSLLDYNIPDWHHGHGGFGQIDLFMKNQSITAVVDHKISIFLPFDQMGPEWLEKWSCFLPDRYLEQNELMAHVSINQIHASHGEILSIVSRIFCRDW